ncbi:MAG: hypothetical protein KDE53_26180, partial [Caldilineaceae bacterium]|nr:hypothetical protein [Caldilineaceae bacterium]
FEQHFDSNFSSQTDNSSPLKADDRLGSYLFAADATECVSLLAAAKMASAMGDGEELINALRNSTITQFHTLPDLVADSEALQMIVEEVLCANG